MKTMEVGRVEAVREVVVRANGDVRLGVVHVAARDGQDGGGGQRRGEAKRGWRGCACVGIVRPGAGGGETSGDGGAHGVGVRDDQGGEESPEGKKSGRRRARPRWKAMAHFWSRWRSVESRAANRALDAIEDDDDVKEDVQVRAQGGGERGGITVELGKKWWRPGRGVGSG